MALYPPSAPGAAQKEFKPRLFWATGVVVVCFVVLLGKLYYLQVLHGDEYKGRADENFVKEIRIPADRGQVLDRNHRVLVDSRPSYDVVMTPYFCGRQCEDILDRLGSTLSMTPDELDRASGLLHGAKKLERFRPFTVKVDIAREDLDVLLAGQMDMPGVDVIPTPHRNYRYGAMGGHLIGYMNEILPDELKKYDDELVAARSPQGPYLLGDYVGRRGLERRWERELRGIDGKDRVPVDAKGRLKEDSDLIPEDQRHVAAVPGRNLVLSLDWRLQEFAEKTFPATAGVVLAMDAKTGFLLALVDRPAPDPNKMSGRISGAEVSAIRSDPLQPELFRAIQEHYHPGSTFKALTAIAALEEGVFKPSTTVFCPGFFHMGTARWRCDKDSGHGYVDFTHALGASCDVFFYQAGALLGADAIAKWARASGLGAPTGFDVAGEVPGVIPDVAWHDQHIRPGGYQKGMAVNLAIGQGDVNVTPMQQLVFYGAIATGTVWRPQVVERIEDVNGQVLQEFGPQEKGKLAIHPATREVIMKGLLAAVNEPFGTGWWSRLKDVVMAGKTGTAQVTKMGAKRLKAEQVSYFERDHAWFAAFAPADDPQVVVVVLNEHSGFGASNAAPTASAVVKRFFELRAEDEAERAGTAPAPPAPAGSPPPAPPAVKPAAPDKPKLGAGAERPGGGARGA